MIDQKRLKELVKLMVENDLAELDLQSEGERVMLKRGGRVEAPVQYIAAPPTATVPQGAPAPGPVALAGDSDIGRRIASPMVGTFYAASSPESEPFVNIGDRVEADTVVCLVEAMKVFNEIKAETAGVIDKILVRPGQAVEYGQALFLLR